MAFHYVCSIVLVQHSCIWLKVYHWTMRRKLLLQTWRKEEKALNRNTLLVALEVFGVVTAFLKTRRTTVAFKEDILPWQTANHLSILYNVLTVSDFL